MANTTRNAPATTQATPASDQDICDAYLYLLGRLLVLRQERLDFEKEGFKWNDVIHRKAGDVWANPNLDVAYSEAWIAVDANTCTMIDVPEIRGRYYTIQALNEWGETIVNINERNYPAHPSGTFAFCLTGAPVTVPAGVERIDLTGKKARILIRVELGADPEEAIALQHRITMRSSGMPAIDPRIDVPLFTNDKLPGVEALDRAPAVLASAPDINPGSDALQAKVCAIAAAVTVGAGERSRVDGVIRQRGYATLEQSLAAMGVLRNGWTHPRVTGNYGGDWRMRTAANFIGTWANSQAEVVSFGAVSASPLDGSDTYSLTFPKNDLPASHVKYFWSVICVDAVDHRVVSNLKNRFLLNTQSRLQLDADGSLTLYFAALKPAEAPDPNWLPTPAGKKFVLTWHSYGPDQATVSGKWFPPPLEKR